MKVLSLLPFQPSPTAESMHRSHSAVLSSPAHPTPPPSVSQKCSATVTPLPALPSPVIPTASLTTNALPTQKNYPPSPLAPLPIPAARSLLSVPPQDCAAQPSHCE